MHPLFLSKVPVNEPPPGSPTGPYGESCPLTRAFFFYISLKFLIKIPLNKKLSLLSKALGSVPPFSPKAGPLWKQIFISSALLRMFSGSQVKEPPLQVPLTELPQREPSFIHLSMSPLYKPPSRFPSGAPMERDSHLKSLFYITFWVLRKGSSLQVPLTERP